MDISSLTENILEKPVIRTPHGDFESGKIYRISYRKYENYYDKGKDDATYEIESILCIPEYFCFGKSNDNIKCLFYSFTANAHCFVKTIIPVKSDMEFYEWEREFGDFGVLDITEITEENPEGIVNLEEREFYTHLSDMVCARNSMYLDFASYNFIQFRKRPMAYQYDLNGFVLRKEWKATGARQRSYRSESISHWLSDWSTDSCYGIFATQRKYGKTRVIPIAVEYVEYLPAAYKNILYEKSGDVLDEIKREQGKMDSLQMKRFDWKYDENHHWQYDKVNFKVFI